MWVKCKKSKDGGQRELSLKRDTSKTLEASDLYTQFSIARVSSSVSHDEYITRSLSYVCTDLVVYSSCDS